MSRRKFGAAGLCCCMVVFGILGNIQVLCATSYEIINLPVLQGTVTLSSSFLACDLLNEHYETKQAREAVLIGFFAQVLFFVNIILTLGHKPIDLTMFPNFSMSQEAIIGNLEAVERIFLPIPRILVASYVAFLASQFFEIWAYRAIKAVKFLKSEYLKHNISLFFSTVLVDSLTFSGIALVLLAPEPLSFQSFWEIISSACFIRVACNLVNSLVLKLDLKRKSFE